MLISSVLNKKDMELGRTPRQMAQWVDEKCCEIARHPELKEQALLHKGHAKKFYEELYPLSVFLNVVYGDDTRVTCVPNLANALDFDATVYDRKHSPPKVTKIEITSAYWENEHLRMEHFLKHGIVNMYGQVNWSGTQGKGHVIAVDDDFVAHHDLIEELMRLVKAGAVRKCGAKARYGSNHQLIIYFDDHSWFRAERDSPELIAFVHKEVLSLPLNFGAFHVLGLAGTLLSFDV